MTERDLRTDAAITDRGAAPFLDGFRLLDVSVGPHITIRAAIGGSGPPLLLLHGHPQTHVTWRKVAPALARNFTIVAADLRGYGDSSKPKGGENHAAYAKRSMAKDQVTLMRTLGHRRFGVAGHDRGARVAHRMALDHSDAVARIAVLDIAPPPRQCMRGPTRNSRPDISGGSSSSNPHPYRNG